MSHTQRMENTEQEQQGFTKEKEEDLQEKRVSLSTREAMEYRDYKRQKKRAEILSALMKSEGVLNGREDAGRISDRAARLRQAAVQMTPTRLESAGEFFYRRGVAVDCIVGGEGETLAKVKAYEAKTAVKLHAKELTLIISPYYIEHCRYAEIKREMKKVLRVAKKVKVKVWADKTHPRANLSRLARLCGELGVAYFCVPYFEGCERLKMDLMSGCKLQVSQVQTLAEYQKLFAAGVGRIVTEKGWEIYTEWMREVEKIDFPELNPTMQGQERKENSVFAPPDGKQTAEEEKPLLLPAFIEREQTALPQSSGEKGNCLCRTQGNEWKIL